MIRPMERLPTLNTPRLVLELPRWQDIPKIVEYAGHEAISANTLSFPNPYAEKDAIFWINTAWQGMLDKSKYVFGIRLLDTDDFIGGMGLHTSLHSDRAELGYWIAAPYWNQGYATEAATAVLRFGFETLNLHKIHASHFLNNPASGKVMIKNGMIKEGEQKDHLKKGDQYLSLALYRLTKEEYIAIHKKS